MFRCLILDVQKHPGDPAETSDDDRENTAEPVPHSSSSHWEWRPEYEVSLLERGDPVVTRRRVVAKRPPTVCDEEIRQKRSRSEPVPELFPLTGEELSDDVFEILIDLFASAGSEHCEDSVYTQDRDRARPLKRLVEVSRMGFVAGQRSCGTGQGSVESTAKPHPPCPLDVDVEKRWNREGSKSSIAPTLTSDGESAILQWTVNEGHLLESGDLKTAFLSGDPDPAYKRSDALYINPPSDLKRWLNLGPEDVVRLRTAVYVLFDGIRGSLRQADFVSLQIAPRVWILPASSPVKGVSLVGVPTKLKAAAADSSVSPVPEIRMNRWKRQRNVLGVLGVHFDDLVGGGNLAYQKAVQWLRTELEFGTWDQSRFRFRGRE